MRAELRSTKSSSVGKTGSSPSFLWNAKCPSKTGRYSAMAFCELRLA